MADRIVYSTESGDLRGRDDRKQKSGGRNCAPSMPRDGIVRVRRETSGRGGKTVTAVYGLPLSGDRLDELAVAIKRKCGTGGAVKDGVVIIQGDRVDAVMRLLTEEGFTVKKAGG